MIGLCIICGCISWVLSFIPGAEMIRMLLLLLITFCMLWSFLQILGTLGEGSFEHLIKFIASTACMFLAIKQIPGENIIKVILIFACGAGIISTIIYSLR